MSPAHVVTLLVVAASWGSSFLFMNVAAPQFGALPLAALRVGLAAAFLLPLLLWQGQWGAMVTHWRRIALVGLGSAGLPFILFSSAALVLPSALASIFNATTPLFGAIIAWLWLKNRLTPLRVVGLLIGFAGVLYLGWGKARIPSEAGTGVTLLAMLACLGATCFYGWAANFTKRYLMEVPSLAVVTGSMLASTALLALPAWWSWPPQTPGASAWAAAGALAILCTALAYMLYVRLIASIGPANAMTVTYLVPVFGILWGALFLGESVTTTMVLGCAIILAGTALTTGMIKGWRTGRGVKPLD